MVLSMKFKIDFDISDTIPGHWMVFLMDFGFVGYLDLLMQPHSVRRFFIWNTGRFLCFTEYSAILVPSSPAILEITMILIGGSNKVLNSSIPFDLMSSTIKTAQSYFWMPPFHGNCHESFSMGLQNLGATAK